MHQFTSQDSLVCRELIHAISGCRCLFLHRRELCADGSGQLLAIERYFHLFALDTFARHQRHSSTPCAQIRRSSWKAHRRGCRVCTCNRFLSLYHWDNNQLWQPATRCEPPLHVQLSVAIDGWVPCWLSNLRRGCSPLK